MTKTSVAPKVQGLPPEIRAVTEVYMESLNCPRSLTVHILIRYGEWDQVARLKAKPIDYGTSSEYHLAACATDWLRKSPDLPVKVDRRAEAIKSWHQSEEECRISNIFLRDARLNHDELSALIDVASSFVADILGPCPLDLTPRFGPGATVSDLSTNTTVLDKVSSPPTLTSGAACLLSLWDGTAWERSHFNSELRRKDGLNPRIVRGNAFFTVPKTALIDRGCSKGPSINVSYQLAVGRVMRDRMRTRIGLNLSSGQAVHQLLAKIGSKSGLFATLDSERASDTMAKTLVDRLLSKSGFWPDLLNSLREEQTSIDGEWFHIHKFSAMGNGFTFELESLLFLSLCYAVGWAHGLGGFPGEFSEHTVDSLISNSFITTYGDDIIVPTFMADDVMRLLSACGFTVNLQKSYLDGEFRESCGGDFYRGVDVSTPKLTKSIQTPADWFSVHNLLKKRFVDQYPCLNANRVLQRVKDQLPKQYRSMYGPEVLGDLVLHGWYGPNIRARARIVNEICGPIMVPSERFHTDANQWVATVKVLEPKLVRAAFDDYDPEAQLAYFLYTGRSAPPTRRPTRIVQTRIASLDMDYHVCFEDYVPRAPRWLASSPFARFFGLTEEGKYVG